MDRHHQTHAPARDASADEDFDATPVLPRGRRTPRRGRTRRAVPARRALFAAATVALAATASARGQCQLQRLDAEMPAPSDQHGDAVATSGDWLAVGASRADDAFVSQGLVTVYRLQDGLWVFEQTLLAPDAMANDLFGWSVDVDAFAVDGPVLVAGAYLHDAAGNNAGAAYVFRYDAGAPAGARWIFEQKLQAPTPVAGDEFGEAVAVSGDLVAVGIARRDDAGSNAGAIALFEWTGVTWSAATQLLIPAEAFDGDRFGASVDVVADAPDGPLVVGGAPLSDVAGPVNAGAAWVFRRQAGGGAWVEEARLDAGPDAGEGDRLGESVAAASSADGDVVAAGAWLDDDQASNAGSVAVFRAFAGTPITWDLEAILLASPADASADDQLGRAVAIDEAGTRIVAGVALADDEGASSGAAVVFEDIGGGTWDRIARLVALAAMAGDQAGTSVAIEGDLVATGARGADGPAGEAGAGTTWLFTLAGVDCTDCDGNGTPDGAEILADPSLDCDMNGVLDVCQIDQDSDAPGGPFFCDPALGDCDPDCNANGLLDACEIADGSVADDDMNGVPDECEDCNDNGKPDGLDIEFGTSLDCNGDGVPDECEFEADPALDCNDDFLLDACQITDDPALDCDGDGVLDACQIASDPDLDCDGNGVLDACDVDPTDPDGDGDVADDCDENGRPDTCDDCNDNGIADDCDIDANPGLDLNGDGIIDSCQDCNGNGAPDFIEVNPVTDCNGDGILDECQIDESTGAPGEFHCDPDVDDCLADCNANGVLDTCEIEDDPGLDTDLNGVIDTCEDCNENGIPDGTDIADGTLDDCDEDGVPDSCAIADGTVADCDGNGVPDACDIADGTYNDCDEDGVPDPCQEDCNDNGIADGCDIADGTSDDFNGNGIPDECDPDCNENLIVDDLEIQFGLAEDCNGNGIPDDCDVDPADPDGDGEVSEDVNMDGVPDECSGADLDGDGVVGFADLLLLITAYGDCPDPPADCVGDIDGDGLVGFQDLLAILEAWTV